MEKDIFQRLEIRDKRDFQNIAKFVFANIGSYLIYEVSRFDIKGKKQLATQEKYYAVDLGIRRYLIGQKRPDDIGHCLEKFGQANLRKARLILLFKSLWVK
ncbi:MAG: hypothetical protein LBH25_14875 [Fibromonadaceae bacterium]|jgi:predicted AAA+ superfamily ATPase|nr:hypothetical protein [Fibromonadaceae bacterium]